MGHPPAGRGREGQQHIELRHWQQQAGGAGGAGRLSSQATKLKHSGQVHALHSALPGCLPLPLPLPLSPFPLLPAHFMNMKVVCVTSTQWWKLW
jgi:hypothetical protein